MAPETKDKPLKQTPKQIAYAALRSLPLPRGEAAQRASISYDYAKLLDKQLPKCLDIITTKRVKKALKAHDKVLDCFTQGKLKENCLKGSDVSAAIDRVLDRHQPKKVEQTPVTQSFTQIDLNIVATGSTPPLTVDIKHSNKPRG